MSQPCTSLRTARSAAKTVLVWFRTGRDDANENGVLRAPSSEDDVDGGVRRLVEPFAARSLPMIVGLHARAARAGARSGAPQPWSGARLRPPRNGARPAIRIRTHPRAAGDHRERVRDEAGLRDWAVVVGRAFGDPGFGEGPSVAFTAVRGSGDERPLPSLRVSRGEPDRRRGHALAGVPGVAGLANISTLPEWRGGGIGAAVASAAFVGPAAWGSRARPSPRTTWASGCTGSSASGRCARRLTYVGRPAAGA